MATKTYDSGAAMNPAGQVPQQQPGQEDQETGELEYGKFIEQLPEEFRGEIEEALAAMLNYVHSDEGTSEILELIQMETKDVSAQIGKTAMMAMDAADPDHQWSDSAKVFAGFFAVKEIAGLAREAGIADVDEQQESEIFKQAAQNYLYYMIKSKPTPEERDKEAIRIQREVEPLMTEKMRAAGRGVAQERGIPVDDQQAAGAGAKTDRGLLE